jgi:hypothetical protein
MRAWRNCQCPIPSVAELVSRTHKVVYENNGFTIAEKYLLYRLFVREYLPRIQAQELS